MSQPNVSILIEALDRFSEPAKKIAKTSSAMADQLESSQKALSSLKGQKKALKGYEQLEQQLQQTTTQYDHVRQATAQLGRQLAKTTQPTEKLKTAFEQAKHQSNQLKNQHYSQSIIIWTALFSLRGAKGQSPSALPFRVEFKVHDNLFWQDKLIPN